MSSPQCVWTYSPYKNNIYFFYKGICLAGASRVNWQTVTELLDFASFVKWLCGWWRRTEAPPPPLNGISLSEGIGNEEHEDGEAK